MTHTSLRPAHVWLDEYKEKYFSLRPDMRTRSYGNTSKHVELMGCKSSKWCLDNIVPRDTDIWAHSQTAGTHFYQQKAKISQSPSMWKALSPPDQQVSVGPALPKSEGRPSSV